MEWAPELRLRLELRMVRGYLLMWSAAVQALVSLQDLLRTFAHPIASDPREWSRLVQSCQNSLREISHGRQPSIPPEGSSARDSFDPAICRYLINHIPLPIVELLDFEKSRATLNEMLLGMGDTCDLEKSMDLLAWEVQRLVILSSTPKVTK